MFKTLGLAFASSLFVAQNYAKETKKNFVQKWIEEKKGSSFINSSNLFEYYGSIGTPPEKMDENFSYSEQSFAYLTVGVSYEYQSKYLRFHFNMKEPGGEYFSENDMQWNTHLDLGDQYDLEMINTEKGLLNLDQMITVYSFKEDRLVQRKTCMFQMVFSEKKGKVVFDLEATPLVGDNCIHRDELD